jgi:hypothetical protein
LILEEGFNTKYPNVTAYSILSIVYFASIGLFLDKSHLGLSGTPFLIKTSDKMPTTPNKNIYLQFGVYPIAIVSSEAAVPPKCQVPSIPILILPR